jgi:hypothetical protein
MKSKRYTIKRIVVEWYKVEANNKFDALRKMKDPYNIIVQSDQIVDIEDKDEE